MRVFRAGRGLLVLALLALALPASARAADVTGTSGNDFIFMQGEIGQFTATLVNPYSGASVDIDAEKNINTASYDGLGGNNDFLILTDFGDVLVLEGDLGEQVVANIERVLAGDGEDVIDLASTTYVLGNMILEGGRANDLIWANVGNDTLNGFTGDDILDGGPGNDSLIGGDGADDLNGGTGDDIYVYNAEDGADRITDTDGADELRVSSSFSLADLTFSRLGDDLVIDTDGTGLNTITIVDHFAPGASVIEKIEFGNNGATYSLDQCGLFDDAGGGVVIDTFDTDGDAIADCADACPNDATNDADGDGVCGAVDVCPGADDTLDTDTDGTPDCLDTCPFDAQDDADGDGVCGDGDICPGADDTIDTDHDGAPDCADLDDDNDGVADGGDADPLNPFVCSDVDADTCDDCASGVFDPANDGPDIDADGVCDAGEGGQEDAGEPIDWVDRVGVATNGPEKNTLSKTAGDGWGNGGAASSQMMPGDGSVCFTPAGPDASRMLGLSGVNADAHFKTLWYAIFARAGGEVRVFEKGANMGTYGTYVPGDELCVERVDDTILYTRNGEPLYTSTVPSSGDLIADAALYHDGAMLTDARIEVLPEEVCDGIDNDGDGAVDEGFVDIDSDGQPDCAALASPIVWQNETGLSVGANNLVKFAGDGWGNGGASSVGKIPANGGVSFVTAEASRSRMLGLSSVDASASYNTINYAIFARGGGEVRVFENGTNKGTYGAYTTGDVLGVERVGTTIRYTLNGAVIYTSTVPSSGNLIADAALYNQFSSILGGMIYGAVP